MEFGLIDIEDAEGAVLAHSFALPSGRVAKGRILNADDIALFRAEGVQAVTAARLSDDDIDEEVAAHRLAGAIVGDGIDMEIAVGGRVNLIASAYGLLDFDRAWLDALNGVHESMTLATPAPFTLVEPGQMVGTVKVIPFAVPKEILSRAESKAAEGGLSVAGVRPCNIGLIQTMLPGTRDKVLEKTAVVTRRRVEALGCVFAREDRCDHDIVQLADAIQAQIDAGIGLVLVVGASAVTDRRDVIPAAIERVSGTINHFGMPVDPGNLMLVGRVGEVPVLGVPGCARSPKRNGFDWVLQRLVCGLPLESSDIAAMGAGGLLKEISARGMPRAKARHMTPQSGPRIYTLVLAAGDDPSILAVAGGVPNVAGVVGAALQSCTSGVCVVTGAREDAVTAALRDHAVSYTHNPAHGDGISTSLRRGLSALPADADGVVVCLGNDQAPTAAVIDALIGAFDPNIGRALCMPVRQKRRDNPLLIGRQFFAELHELEGDVGARYLIGAYPTEVAHVSVDDVELIDNDATER